MDDFTNQQICKFNVIFEINVITLVFIWGLVNVFTFPENPDICPVQFLKDYLARTAPIWHDGVKKLFVTYTKLHKCVISQTWDR